MGRLECSLLRRKKSDVGKSHMRKSQSIIKRRENEEHGQHNRGIASAGLFLSLHDKVLFPVLCI